MYEIGDVYRQATDERAKWCEFADFFQTDPLGNLNQIKDSSM